MEYYKDLLAFKKGYELAMEIFTLSKKFPPEEKYSLVDDMTRAARSSTQNIAEGFGRFHYQENMQFCRQSRGSVEELIDQLIAARDEKYIADAEYQEGRELINKALALLNGYINYLARAKSNKSRITHNE